MLLRKVSRSLWQSFATTEIQATKTFNLALLNNKFSEKEIQKAHTCTKKEGIANGYIGSNFFVKDKNYQSSISYLYNISNEAEKCVYS